MKSILTTAIMTIASTAAFAESGRLGFDGCYVMYQPSVMYPAFCLQGTAEEGIAGSNVRLAIFGTNTDKVISCLRSDASAMTEDSYTFIVQGRKEMILKNVVINQDRKQGDVVLGRTELKFLELDNETTDRLMSIAQESCSNN
jgi:hypothetical protein